MRELYDELDTAIYDLVHDHKGGAPALSPLVNINAGTLNNKVNPASDSHHLNVREAVAIMATRNAYPVLHAMAHVLGFVCVEVGEFDGLSDMELLSLYLEWHRETGETAAEIKKTLDDGKVTRAEVDKVKREVMQDISAIYEFIARLESLVEE